MENKLSAAQLRESMTEKQYAFAEALAQGLEPIAAAKKAGFGEKIAGAQAAKMLKKGGRLIYSTCTFNPDENENTI